MSLTPSSCATSRSNRGHCRQAQEAAGVGQYRAAPPQELPAFVPASDSTLHIYASDVNFFCGVALRADATDPAAHVREVSRLLGYEADAAGSDLNASRIAAEIAGYLDMHSYADTLRLNVVNPGGGELVRDVALALLREPDIGERNPLRSLDIVAHTDPETIQRPAPGLDELVARGYQSATPRGWSHLHPMIQVARRPVNEAADMPGHDTHLALCLIPGRSSRCAANPTRKARAWACRSFQSLHVLRGWHRVVTQGCLASRHRSRSSGSQGTLTELLALHQEYLRLCARVQDDAAGGCLPCLRLTLIRSTRLLTLHDRADWVMTIDRHFGIDHDDPGNGYSTQLSATCWTTRSSWRHGPSHDCDHGMAEELTMSWRPGYEMALSSDNTSCRVVFTRSKLFQDGLRCAWFETPQEKDAISLRYW